MISFLYTGKTNPSLYTPPNQANTDYFFFLLLEFHFFALKLCHRLQNLEPDGNVDDFSPTPTPNFPEVQVVCLRSYSL